MLLISIDQYTLPTTMNIKLWGGLLSKTKDLIIIQRYRSKSIFQIKPINPLINQIEILVGEKVILNFRDELINENNLRSFIRYIDNDEYHYENGKISFKIQSTFQELIYLQINSENQLYLYLMKNF